MFKSLTTISIVRTEIDDGRTRRDETEEKPIKIAAADGALKDEK